MCILQKSLPFLPLACLAAFLIPLTHAEGQVCSWCSVNKCSWRNRKELWIPLFLIPPVHIPSSAEVLKRIQGKEVWSLFKCIVSNNFVLLCACRAEIFLHCVPRQICSGSFSNSSEQIWGCLGYVYRKKFNCINRLGITWLNTTLSRLSSDFESL